jgi:hypothetical protein
MALVSLGSSWSPADSVQRAMAWAATEGRPWEIVLALESGLGGEAFVAMVKPPTCGIAVTLPRFGS